MFGYDPETKQQSSQWKTPTSSRPKKVCLFGAMANQCWFVSLTTKALWIRCKHPDSCATTPATCIMTMLRFICHTFCGSFLASRNAIVIPHPPYPPDLTACDFSDPQRWNWSSWGDILKAVKRSRPNILQTVLPIMGIPLGLLYQCRMGLLPRGWRRIEILVSS